jgi:hypothetical protein
MIPLRRANEKGHANSKAGGFASPENSRKLRRGNCRLQVSGLDSKRPQDNRYRQVPILFIVAFKYQEIGRRTLSVPSLEGRCFPSNVQFARTFRLLKSKHDFHDELIPENTNVVEPSPHRVESGRVTSIPILWGIPRSDTITPKVIGTNNRT